MSTSYSHPKEYSCLQLAIIERQVRPSKENMSPGLFEGKLDMDLPRYLLGIHAGDSTVCTYNDIVYM